MQSGALLLGQLRSCGDAVLGAAGPRAARGGSNDPRGLFSEVISVGFWAGSGAVQEAAFYAYAAPEPAGLRELVPRPSSVYYHAPMGIFVLPYVAVRTAASPAD